MERTVLSQPMRRRQERAVKLKVASFIDLDGDWVECLEKGSPMPLSFEKSTALFTSDSGFIFYAFGYRDGDGNSRALVAIGATGGIDCDEGGE